MVLQVVVGWIQTMQWATTLVEAGEHFAVQKPISSILGFLVLKQHSRILIFQVVVFLGLVLCCTHLSEITLTIAANIFHTFFMFYGKFYWWICNSILCWNEC